MKIQLALYCDYSWILALTLILTDDERNTSVKILGKVLRELQRAV
jgi:hypothetical protein